MIIWLDPKDCDPPHSLNLEPGSRDSLKVEGLVEAFQVGFDTTKPALVGYPLSGRIQLLSGTHRHEAALRVGIQLPVTLFLRSYVEATWGTIHWTKVMRDISVNDLEAMETGVDVPPGLDERINDDVFK